MKKLIGITLGLMTALGGFVDLGQIVFTTQAGALFGYRLLWAVVFGTLAIIVYMEMCGRVAVVAHEPVFRVVRTRLGTKLGLITLVASNLLNLLTCAAELGGLAIGIHLLTGWPERAALIGTTFGLGLIIFLFRFQWIERFFGLSGLLMCIFVVSACWLHPDWKCLVQGLSPLWHPSGRKSGLLYAYFAVGIFSAMLMAYEVHFYSSGAMEEDWKPKDLRENFMIASLGSFLGSILTVGMMALGAILFLPRGIFPQQLSTVIIAGSYPFAQKGLVVAVLGSLACIGGAAVETALSSGYNVCQFFDWNWGKNIPAKSVPVYTATWMGILLLALVIAISGVRPLQLVNISIIFGMVIMPLTYYPILRAAADKKLMGQHVNTRGVTAVGMFFLLAIVIAAIAAFPLMIVTHSGRP